MILIEIEAATNAAGATKTFYFSTEPFVTEPSDTPANTSFLPLLLDAGRIGLNVFADGAAGGGTALEVGSVRLANADGRFDAFQGYSVDGRRVVIRSGKGGAYPDAFPIVFTGTADGIEPGWSDITIRLRDKQYVFDRPTGLHRYLGTNVAPNGLEGTPSDIKDRFKPRVLGSVFNMTPVLVNASKLTFQVNDGAVEEIAVYDRGAALDLGVDHATSALLQTATVAAGEFDTCLAEGYFRLGSMPAGEITADVVEGPSEADRTVAQVLWRLASSAGLTVDEISAADVAALDEATSAEVGIFLDGEDTYRSAMDIIATSAGASYTVDPEGVLRMAVLQAPDSEPALTLYDYDLSRDVEITAARESNVPVWSVTVNYGRAWTTQTDLAGDVDEDRRAFVKDEYRKVTAQAPEVKDQFRLAGEIVVDTLLTSREAAQALANLLLALHRVARVKFIASVSVDLLTKAGVWLAGVVALDVNRFGMSGGKSFRTLGIRFQLAQSRAYLTLWG